MAMAELQAAIREFHGDPARVYLTGISMGGAVSQWLAINAPQRLTKLVLANTSPKFGTRETWDDRRKAVLQGGIQLAA